MGLGNLEGFAGVLKCPNSISDIEAFRALRIIDLGKYGYKYCTVYII